MEIRHYINIIIKRLWIILLFPIIAGGVSVYTSMSNYVAMYESGSTLLVVSKAQDTFNEISYNDLLVGQQLAIEYKEIIKSHAVTSEVINELGFKNLQPEALAGKINVSLKPETRIITVHVQDQKPDTARILADKVTEVFIKRAEALTQMVKIEYIDKPQTPVSPIQPDYIKKLIIGVMAGLLLALMLVFIIEELDDTIKTVEDVEKELEIKVLGTIPILNIK